MAKNRGFMNAVSEYSKNFRIYGTQMMRMQMMDRIIITLGELNYSPEQIALFEDKFYEVERETCELVINDAKDDEEIVFSKKKTDDLVNQYLPNDRKLDWNKRYEKQLDRIRYL